MAEEETTGPDEGADEQTIAETPQEEVSREDELGAIFDAANAEETQEDGPARGADGKFIAKETATEEGATQGIVSDTSAEPAEEVTPEVIDPPASLSENAKAAWPNLDPILQQELLKREADWQTADGERATKLKGYEPIEVALTPVRQRLALSGVSDGQYVSSLVAADEYLRTDPAGAMQWIANQYGIDLSQLTTGPEFEDPVIAPFAQRINSLESTIQNFAASQQQAEAQRIDSELEAFSKDHPHFEEVRTDMGALMQAGAASLQEAYDRAVWANPSTRAKMQAEQSAAAEAEKKAEAEKRAKEARRTTQTNLSNTGSGGGTTPPQFKDRQEELGSIYDQAQGA